MPKAITTISGPITEPELNYTTSGLAVVKFSIANDVWSSGKNETQWIKMVGFGDKHEKLVTNGTIGKGTIVQVTGQMKLVQWKTKADKVMAWNELTIDSIVLVANFGKAYSGAKYQVGEDEQIAEINAEIYERAEAKSNGAE
jgi:single-stranded DNA-binding protein